VMFDDDHAVAGAGLALVGVLSEKLGLEDLAGELVDIKPFPGQSDEARSARTGRGGGAAGSR
jgi:hypothetical protein